MKVWIIIHCEIRNINPTVVDEMVFHVASSFEKAEAYVKKVGIFGDAGEISKYYWSQAFLL